MRMKIAGATFLIVGAGAASVGALDNVALQGSDTLEHFTNSVLASVSQRHGSAGITYRGGGSSTGENAMTAATPTQTVSPMSRFLNPTAGVCAKSRTAEGLVVALDGLSIVGKQTTTDTCGGGAVVQQRQDLPGDGRRGAPVVDCVGCTAGTNNYAFTDWRDVITMVYTGKGHAVAPLKVVITTARRPRDDGVHRASSTRRRTPARGLGPVRLGRRYPGRSAALYSFPVPGTSLVLDFGAGTYARGTSSTSSPPRAASPARRGRPTRAADRRQPL